MLRGRPSLERYIVPVFIEDCNLLERLVAWNAVRLFEPDGYSKLAAALRERARALGRTTE